MRRYWHGRLATKCATHATFDPLPDQSSWSSYYKTFCWVPYVVNKIVVSVCVCVYIYIYKYQTKYIDISNVFSLVSCIINRPILTNPLYGNWQSNDCQLPWQVLSSILGKQLANLTDFLCFPFLQETVVLLLSLSPTFLHANYVQ
jgi:hypothetical protein